MSQVDTEVKDALLRLGRLAQQSSVAEAVEQVERRLQDGPAEDCSWTLVSCFEAVDSEADIAIGAASLRQLAENCRPTTLASLAAEFDRRTEWLRSQQRKSRHGSATSTQQSPDASDPPSFDDAIATQVAQTGSSLAGRLSPHSLESVGPAVICAFAVCETMRKQPNNNDAVDSFRQHGVKAVEALCQQLSVESDTSRQLQAANFLMRIHDVASKLDTGLTNLCWKSTIEILGKISKDGQLTAKFNVNLLVDGCFDHLREHVPVVVKAAHGLTADVVVKDNKAWSNSFSVIRFYFKHLVTAARTAPHAFDSAMPSVLRNLQQTLKLITGILLTDCANSDFLTNVLQYIDVPVSLAVRFLGSRPAFLSSLLELDNDIAKLLLFDTWTSQAPHLDLSWLDAATWLRLFQSLHDIYSNDSVLTAQTCLVHRWSKQGLLRRSLLFLTVRAMSTLLKCDKIPFSAYQDGAPLVFCLERAVVSSTLEALVFTEATISLALLLRESELSIFCSETLLNLALVSEPAAIALRQLVPFLQPADIKALIDKVFQTPMLLAVQLPWQQLVQFDPNSATAICRRIANVALAHVKTDAVVCASGIHALAQALGACADEASSACATDVARSVDVMSSGTEIQVAMCRLCAASAALRGCDMNLVLQKMQTVVAINPTPAVMYFCADLFPSSISRSLTQEHISQLTEIGGAITGSWRTLPAEIRAHVLRCLREFAKKTEYPQIVRSVLTGDARREFTALLKQQNPVTSDSTEAVDDNNYGSSLSRAAHSMDSGAIPTAAHILEAAQHANDDVLSLATNDSQMSQAKAKSAASASDTVFRELHGTMTSLMTTWKEHAKDTPAWFNEEVFRFGLALIGEPTT